MQSRRANAVLRRVVLLLFVFAPIGSVRLAAARQFYVDQTNRVSSDLNSGTENYPWATIQRAADALQPGDSVLVKAGRYQERVVCNRSGLPGAPIVFEGQRGADGEWLTIVDGGDAAPAWVPAPEASPPEPYNSYTYKTVLTYNPYAMVVDDKDIPRLGWAPGTPYEGFTYLRYPPDQLVRTEYERLVVDYWDGIDALYYPVHDSENAAYTVYLRFRNGENPNGMDIRMSPAGAAFTIRDRSHITVRNFKMLGAQIGVVIRGSGATHNIVENNQITTGQKRIYLGEGAARNHIRRNEMFMDALSPYRPGGWNGARQLPDRTQRYEHAVKEHIYNVYKHEVGNGSTWSPDDDAGIKVKDPGAGNEIHDNHIHDTLCGVEIFDVPYGLKIYGNTVGQTSSTGISAGPRQFDLEVFDNLLCDSNNNFRIQEMDQGDRRIYFYRNRLYNAQAEGDNMYFHWGEPNSTPAEVPEVWVYHNTFVGSRWGMTISERAEGSTAAAGTCFVNNVYSPTPTRPLFGYVPTSFGFYDYNWAGGQHPFPLPVWFGPHNVDAEGQELWAEETVPDFRLPVDCAARRAGLDLSRPFQLDGATYPPLPGMESGYFQGDAPDLGAIQASGLDSGEPPTNP